MIKSLIEKMVRVLWLCVVPDSVDEEMKPGWWLSKGAETNGTTNCVSAQGPRPLFTEFLVG